MKRLATVISACIFLICLLLFTVPCSAANDNAITYLAIYQDGAGHGSISVESTPDKASLYVDGRFQGHTPMTINVDNGRHYVSVSKSDTSDWSGTVYIKDNEARINAKLNSQSAGGYLSLNSSPGGANVYIDNIYRGDTPLTLFLSANTYNVVLQKSGYKPYSSRVSIKEGKTSTISAALQSDSGAGYLSVSTNPRGAAVYVDGGYFGTTPANGAPLTLGPYASDTTHTVTVSCDGYKSQTQTFSVNADQTKTITVTLAKDAAQNASVSVSSSPAGAYIFIDNQFIGVTPVTIPNVETGSHVLKLTAAGYADWEETVTVASGENLQKAVAMSPAAAPAPVNTPVPAAGLLAGLLGTALLFIVRRT